MRRPTRPDGAVLLGVVEYPCMRIFYCWAHNNQGGTLQSGRITGKQICR